MEAQGFVCNPVLFDVTDLERATRGHFQVWRSCFFFFWVEGACLYAKKYLVCLVYLGYRDTFAYFGRNRRVWLT